MQPLSSSRRRRVLLTIIFTITALCSFDMERISSFIISNAIKNYTHHNINDTFCGVAAADGGGNTSLSPCHNNNAEHLLHPLNLNKSFSFLHISKCGGVSWFQELGKLVPTERLFLSYQNGHPKEHGLYYQNQNNIMNQRSNEIDYYKLATFRSPRLHVYSQFRHCSFSDWGRVTTVRNGKGFPRDSGDVMANFHRWLDHFINTTNFDITNLDSFGCYHPVNLQSRFLTTNAVLPFIPTLNMDYFRDHWMPYPNYTEVEHNLHEFD